VPATGGWQSVETVSFDIDTTRLQNCSVQIVAWTDDDVFWTEAGLKGIFTGNAGTLYTGGFAIRKFTSNVSALLTPSPTMGDFETWITNSTSVPSIVLWQIQSIWNSAVFTNPPAGMKWIWDTMFPIFQTDNYRSFVFPCSAVVTHFPAPPEPPSNPLDDDHFACYLPNKIQEMTETELVIEDQFGEAKIVIGKPVLHCNPSFKRHDGQDFPIHNRIRHLVCYEILGQSEMKAPPVEIKNQIESNIYIVEQQREMFCVPSSKEEL
jgi:hypothetical protein